MGRRGVGFVYTQTVKISCSLHSWSRIGRHLYIPHPRYSRRCCLFFLFYLSPRARFSKAPVTSRLLGRSKYLNLTPRSLGREKGTCSFGTGRFVITYPMLRPPGPARRCNQNEWFENSITLITSIKVSIRRGCSFILRFSSFAMTRRVWRTSQSALQNSQCFFFIYSLLQSFWYSSFLIAHWI